jgi:hypothetical protein
MLNRNPSKSKKVSAALRNPSTLNASDIFKQEFLKSLNSPTTDLQLRPQTNITESTLCSQKSPVNRMNNTTKLAFSKKDDF